MSNLKVKNFTVIGLEKKVLKTKLEFENPLQVSQGDSADQMIFTLTEPQLFFDSEIGLHLDPNSTTFTFYLPKMIIDSQQMAILTNTA